MAGFPRPWFADIEGKGSSSESSKGLKSAGSGSEDGRLLSDCDAVGSRADRGMAEGEEWQMREEVLADSV